jgi:hypothetical protein
MADQIEVTKLNQTAVIGPTADSISVPKLVMYVLLEPGAGDSGNRQGHVYSRVIVRSS